MKSDTKVNIKGSNNRNVGNLTYNGLTRDDLITMVEERFHHMLKKEAQIDLVFEENRKLTEELIRQNEVIRNYNEAYRRQVDRIAELTDKLLKKSK